MARAPQADALLHLHRVRPDPAHRRLLSPLRPAPVLQRELVPRAVARQFARRRDALPRRGDHDRARAGGGRSHLRRGADAAAGGGVRAVPRRVDRRRPDDEDVRAGERDAGTNREPAAAQRSVGAPRRADRAARLGDVRGLRGAHRVPGAADGRRGDSREPVVAHAPRGARRGAAGRGHPALRGHRRRARDRGHRAADPERHRHRTRRHFDARHDRHRRRAGHGARDRGGFLGARDARAPDVDDVPRLQRLGVGPDGQRRHRDRPERDRHLRAHLRDAADADRQLQRRPAAAHHADGRRGALPHHPDGGVHDGIVPSAAPISSAISPTRSTR